MHDTESINRRTLRLPQDALEFLSRKARANMTSVNSEIVRSVRERALREGDTTAAGKSPEKHPAAADRTAALPGGNSYQPG